VSTGATKSIFAQTKEILRDSTLEKSADWMIASQHLPVDIAKFETWA
jgi:hypothetical protein